MNFKEKVLNIIRKIKKNKVKTYKEIAKLSGRPKAYRAIANILSQNRNPNIPCHRVIKNDYTVGGYKGSLKNSWLKLALLLKEGIIAVMPTDTIYGICGNALKRKVVERIYKLRRRNPQKPMIILISSFDDLKTFGIYPTKQELEILNQIWPGNISVILSIKDKNKLKELEYLHRGTKTLALRLPRPKWLINILKISGPLVAPSANWEGFEPAKTINEAKKYFGNKVIYFDRGKISGKPSTLLKLENNKISVLRKGSGYKKISRLLKI